MENTEVLRKKCNSILRSWVGEALITKWLSSALVAFNNRTPEEVWSENPDKVYKYLLGTINGQYVY